KAGFHTLLDLYNAQDWQIRNVEGVGDKQITAIRNILGEFLRRLSEHSHIRLTADKDDRKSLALITEIARFRQCSKIGQEAAPLVGAVHTYAEEAPGRVLIRGRLRWFFSRRQTKEDTILAVGGILAYLRSPECARVKNLIDLYEQARSLSEDEALDDFKKNGAAYYALIEKLTGTGADRELIYSSIPAQLADEIDAFPLDTGGFKGDLRAYQVFGARYILALGRVLLGDEMGLGKTIQAIAAMAHLHAKDPGSWFLIVCPASVMVNWCREIHKFSVIRALLLHGAYMGEALESWKQDGGAAVTNYESLSKIVGAVDGKMKLSMLVIDEAHYIKNPEAKRTRYIHKLEDEAERILMMTGTPLENKVDEMCELIGFVRPDLVEEIRSSAGMRHVPQFREILAPVYLRRRREMVLSELPPLTMEEEWCAMTPEDSEAYREQVQKGNFIGMRRVSFLQEDLGNSSKAVRLREICEEAIEEEKKVVVYSYFRDTIGKVIGLLGEAVEGSITGSTPAQERQDIIDRFTTAPGGRILVCQVQSGGTGLNIQAAGIVIFCEPQIKPSLTWQSLSRVYRMGQVQNVLVCHLLCENT
ncbi:MAG: DEAD/DEAH box helicase, partial [Eubacteriales bacterium]|nr:DEAD/DEAH box helicase [Eubacteriales bacterium]